MQCEESQIKPLVTGLKYHSMQCEESRIKPLVIGLKCHSMYVKSPEIGR